MASRSSGIKKNGRVCDGFVRREVRIPTSINLLINLYCKIKHYRSVPDFISRCIVSEIRKHTKVRFWNAVDDRHVGDKFSTYDIDDGVILDSGRYLSFYYIPIMDVVFCFVTSEDSIEFTLREMEKTIPIFREDWEIMAAIPIAGAIERRLGILFSGSFHESFINFTRVYTCPKTPFFWFRNTSQVQLIVKTFQDVLDNKLSLL